MTRPAWSDFGSIWKTIARWTSAPSVTRRSAAWPSRAWGSRRRCGGLTNCCARSRPVPAAARVTLAGASARGRAVSGLHPRGRPPDRGPRCGAGHEAGDLEGCGRSRRRAPRQVVCSSGRDPAATRPAWIRLCSPRRRGRRIWTRGSPSTWTRPRPAPGCACAAPSWTRWRGGAARGRAPHSRLRRCMPRVSPQRCPCPTPPSPWPPGCVAGPVPRHPHLRADTIVLTKNQALMVYRLALACGAPPEFQRRMIEITPVIGGAVVWRQIAGALVVWCPATGSCPRRPWRSAARTSSASWRRGTTKLGPERRGALAHHRGGRRQGTDAATAMAAQARAAGGKAGAQSRGAAARGRPGARDARAPGGSSARCAPEGRRGSPCRRAQGGAARRECAGPASGGPRRRDGKRARIAARTRAAGPPAPQPDPRRGRTPRPCAARPARSGRQHAVEGVGEGSIATVSG